MIFTQANEHATKFVAQAKSRVESLILVAVFSVVLILCSIVTLINCRSDRKIVSYENRLASDFPSVELLSSCPSNYFVGIENFISDRFCFRTNLIASRNWLLYSLLNSSGNDKVILGRNQWMFYGAQEALLAQTNREPYSPLKLRDVAQSFKAKSEWLASHGIKYVLLLLPEKGSVYPEKLPHSLSILPGPSRLEALQNEIAQNRICAYVDGKAALVRAKSPDAPLFTKFDTHWNAAGAQCVLSELCRSLELSLPALNKRIQVVKGGDLANMIALSAMFEEPLPQFDFKQRTAQTVLFEKPKAGDPLATNFAIFKNASAANNLKLLLIGDSFTRTLMPYVSEIAADSTFIYTRDFDTDKILRSQPDVVVEEMVERHLFDLPLERAPEFVALFHETTNPHASIGDSVGRPTFANFSEIYELVDFAFAQEPSGVSVKVLWRAKQPMTLSGNVRVELYDEQQKNCIASVCVAQDFLKRHVRVSDCWLDTFYVPLKSPSDVRGVNLAVTLIDDKNKMVAVAAKQTLEGETKLILPLEQADSDSKFESLFARKTMRYAAGD